MTLAVQCRLFGCKGQLPDAIFCCWCNKKAVQPAERAICCDRARSEQNNLPTNGHPGLLQIIEAEDKGNIDPLKWK